ncbi:uncharacterized protein LOC115622042 isoform X2 [Scaptodrosophila lebanonensis]|uniref:Uncharacterized protein LOC115622042 isoform X2 n=1 Tax=Drosophila lebanonensis TaxID=7225 RepID=A0A6J2T4C0_DROLE|nr:uncharacterized protein LOC115622042 isoform X2 [Scaptodrosophila lebanonensis]
MFGWSGPQRASPITLFCLLLIISIQTNATVPSNMDSAKKRPVSLPVKQVATWRRGPESKLNVRRLYDAYKQRLKLQDDRDDHAKGVRSAAGSARNTNHAHKEQRLKVVKLMISPTRYDATDERQNEDNNNMSPKKTTDVEDEQNDREKPDVKHPVVSGMMILKVDMPTPNPDPKPIQMPLGLSQLIHLYDEYTKSWRQPSGELKPMPVYEEASNAEPIITESAPNALHKLFNVLQHLELDPDALKINRPPQPSNNRESAGPSDRNEAPHRDDFNVLLHRLEPKLSSNIFKRVTDEIGAIRSHIKAGGLYDEYKKRLCQILRDQKNTRNIKSDDSGITSESDMPIDSENSRKTNSVNDCWCDASKPAKFATEKAHAVARLFAKDKMLRKNKPVSNVKGKPQNGYAKALDAFAFCGADACKGNGGQKPYYLPNSKNRQLVWNEVPLLKKGDSSSNSSRLNAVNTTDGSTFVGPVAGPTADGGTSGFGLKFKSKTGERPTFSNLPSKPYSGLDPAHIRTAIHNFRNTSFFSLYDEYQKQIDNLHKVLKSKQNWWNEAQNWTSNGGAIPAEVFPADTEASSEHNHIPSSLAQLEEGVGISNNNHMVFPDVLTQALASSMNVLSPGPITGSGGVLENMATQLNLSPVELAQRIANVGQTGDTRILRNEMLAPNAGPAPNSMPQSASSTSAARMPAVSPMPAINVPVKLAENAIDTTQSSNLAPILDKILQRLQTMQQAKLEETTEDAVAVAPTTDKPLPCCFADPTDVCT